MSTNIIIKPQSVRKYSDGSFTGQVIIHDQNDTPSFYACRINQDLSFDHAKLYEFIASQWRLASLDSTVIESVRYQFVSLLKRTDHLYKRAISGSNGDTRHAMYQDAVLKVSDSSGQHELKIGDRVFYSHNVYDLVAQNGNGSIRFEVLGAPALSGQLNLNDDPDLKRRLDKQFSFAYSAYKRVRNSQPIGGMSWASLQNDRKEFGRSNKDHRQLQRGRS